ncbi:hypothetical protein B296_00000474 [Ensete ventricosum]|uniref:Uncharacterized protein n=1 Tax=Ensete ventricosum TaxID=4639 RepID=A0A427A2B5_ENSVE|nr:hypothetical protein B296_00000474 [Ensete ventricosum]
MGVLKPIKPLNIVSLEVDDSNLHPCSVGGSVERKTMLRTRDPSDRVSFFSSREVNIHTWIACIRDDVTMLLRIVSLVRFEGVLSEDARVCRREKESPETRKR